MVDNFTLSSSAELQIKKLASCLVEDRTYEKRDVLAIVESIGAVFPTDDLKSDEKCRFVVFVIEEVFKQIEEISNEKE